MALWGPNLYNGDPLYVSPDLSPDALVMDWNNGFRGEEVQQHHHHHRGAAYEHHGSSYHQPMSICTSNILFHPYL